MGKKYLTKHQPGFRGVIGWQSRKLAGLALQEYLNREFRQEPADWDTNPTVPRSRHRRNLRPARRSRLTLEVLVTHPFFPLPNPARAV